MSTPLQIAQIEANELREPCCGYKKKRKKVKQPCGLSIYIGNTGAVLVVEVEGNQGLENTAQTVEPNLSKPSVILSTTQSLGPRLAAYVIPNSPSRHSIMMHTKKTDIRITVEPACANMSTTTNLLNTLEPRFVHLP